MKAKSVSVAVVSFTLLVVTITAGCYVKPPLGYLAAAACLSPKY